MDGDFTVEKILKTLGALVAAATVVVGVVAVARFAFSLAPAEFAVRMFALACIVAVFWFVFSLTRSVDKTREKGR
jgi:hypothetical protein